MPNQQAPRTKKNFVRRFFSVLGPGLITGAADDDPSGIATYSIAGAQMGTSLLWTAFITWPLMGCVQFMCARIGMVTGMGLGNALRQKGPRWLLFGGAVALLVANTINVGADLTSMADAAEMLTGANSHIYVVVFGIGITYATIRFRYHQIAMVLKWLAAVLFAYVITAFVIGPNWGAVLPRYLCPFLAARPCHLGESCCDSWYDNQSVSFFLAGFARGRRRKSDGPAHAHPKTTRNEAGNH